MTHEEYQRLLSKAHKDLKLVLSGVEQRRKERDAVAESYARLEEEVQGKRSMYAVKETKLRSTIDQSLMGSTALQMKIDTLRGVYDQAHGKETALRQKIEANKQTLSLLRNQLDVIHQEHEIIAGQIREANTRSKVSISINKLHKNSCSACQKVIAERYDQGKSSADVRMFSITQEQKTTKDKRDLCHCVTM
jgi:chromosome segregation ATPase